MHYLEVEQLQFLAREKCFITAEEEFELMMTLYHDLGIIIKQGTTVILDAKWLIELFRQLITIPDKCVRKFFSRSNRAFAGQCLHFPITNKLIKFRKSIDIPLYSHFISHLNVITFIGQE